MINFLKLHLLCGLVFTLLFSSCKKDDVVESIVGKWGVEHREQKEYENGKLVLSKITDYKTTDSAYNIMVFNADSTLSEIYPNLDSTSYMEPAKYSVSGNVVSIIFKDKIKSDLIFSINNNKLTLLNNKSGETWKSEITLVLGRK